MSETVIILFAIAGLLIATGLLSVVYVQNLRARNYPTPHNSTDLTNMTILFQTMRDVLAQQKQLAEDFNQSLDRRVDEIRNIVEVIRKERDMLRESRGQLIDLLERAKELEKAASAAARRPDESTLTTTREEPVTSGLPAEEVEDIVDIPENDLIANWNSDAVDDDAMLEPDEAPPVIEPVSPEDARAARDAFRTLLNLDETAAATPSAATEPAKQPTNGHAPTRAVEQLVYDYSDAGMRIPEIAKELGIGKGEVRLILSLREDRGS